MAKSSQTISIKISYKEVLTRLRKFYFEFQNDYVGKDFVVDDSAPTWMRRFFEWASSRR